ncbi:MAG TPA: bifunctional phosphoribosylaminoimidazolecarboxamide formyltransferase/IMP cyclohydrolase [Terriglobales bacterium]|nr:bifunctional phosphoribosylaminoimidazolecarboxamide formyltransferase/IMP cyclohydrolase [Terriglobales bacterium]
MRALLSVTDKRGLEPFARRLAALGFELISTGGTARQLRASGLEVREVSDVTQFPEMLDGRVKTLHPSIHGGLLGRVADAGHREQMQAHGITPIDLLVVNLYQFEDAARRGASLAELIENIDIGGPAMLRSAAKNHESVTVVSDPDDYDAVARELETSGAVSDNTRFELALKVFRRTAAYDRAISETLERAAHPQPDDAFPPRLAIDSALSSILRYGENPHQRAALYRDLSHGGGIAQGELLQGKELSYNNLVDLEAAWDLVNDLPQGVPAVAIIKHTNPAGCAQGVHLVDAYRRALACDPVSAYGGVIGLNRPLDRDAAQAIADLFVECIAAPDFAAEAVEILARKKSLRLLRVAPSEPGRRLRSLSGGWLLQDDDRNLMGDWREVTERAPTEEEAAGLRFGWPVAKHVKSNAIVFARSQGGFGATLAVGAGQMSRVDSVAIAALRAQLPLAGSVVASDAFFPFPDGIERAAAAGATAVIQPGGSLRDAEAIATCNRLGLAMVFTGVRHFRH